MRTSIAAALVGCAVLFFQAGCGGAHDYVERGNRYFRDGKYGDAELQYRNAIQKDPNAGEAHYRLGLAEMQENKSLLAYQSLLHAVQLMPENDAAKAKLADVTFALLVADPRHSKVFYDQVGRLADQLLAKNAGSFDGLRLKGSLRLVDRNPKEAIALFEKANRTEPDRPDLILSWVQALFEDKRFEEGERLAVGVIHREKTFGPMYDVLYRQYMSVNRTAEAENILKTKVSNNPKNLGFLLQLARHYATARNFIEMNNVLQRALNDPKDFPNAGLQVGDFYAALGQWDQAFGQFEQGERENPKEKLVYQKRMTDVLVAEGKKDEVAHMVEQILKDAPNDEDARRIRATLWLRSGAPEQTAAALAEFQALTVAKPGDPRLRFLLAQAYLAQGNADKAQNEFQGVIRLRPDDVPSRLALANISLSRRKPDEAIRYAGEILSQHPDNGQAKLLRVTAMVAAGYHRDARTELTRLLREYPKSSDVQFALAMLNITEGKFSDAEEALKKLSKLSPGDQRSEAGLVEVYTAQNQLEKALELLNEDVKKSPDSQAIRRLRAATAVRAQRYDLAIAEYQYLLTKDPQSVGLRMQLGEVYRLKDDSSSAIAVLQQAQQMAPKNPDSAMQLASMFESAGRNAEALASYRRVLELRPDNPFALNSVAFLLAETGGNLDEALKLVQRALEKAPGNPALLDTLGWIYLKKGMKDSALQVFTNLVRQQPQNPEFRYHFALVLLEKGDTKGARTALEAALAAQPAPGIAKKIKALVKQLG
jgi:tetratricopeptide (TPR) repeat protein